MGKGKAKKSATTTEAVAPRAVAGRLDPDPETAPPPALFPTHVTVRYYCDCGVVEVVKLPRFGDAVVKYPVQCLKCRGTMSTPVL